MKPIFSRNRNAAKATDTPSTGVAKPKKKTTAKKTSKKDTAKKSDSGLVYFEPTSGFRLYGNSRWFGTTVCVVREDVADPRLKSPTYGGKEPLTDVKCDGNTDTVVEQMLESMAVGEVKSVTRVGNRSTKSPVDYLPATWKYRIDGTDDYVYCADCYYDFGKTAWIAKISLEGGRVFVNAATPKDVTVMLAEMANISK